MQTSCETMTSVSSLKEKFCIYGIFSNNQIEIIYLTTNCFSFHNLFTLSKFRKKMLKSPNRKKTLRFHKKTKE